MAAAGCAQRAPPPCLAAEAAGGGGGGGGGAAGDDGALLTALTPEALSVEAALAFVSLPSTGAAVAFCGTTRTPGLGGRPVDHLYFEAHEPLARAGLLGIAREAAARFRLARVAVLHRLGAVPVGQASLVVAASAPHRADALAALGEVVDWVKARVAVFKREVYADGSGAWVRGCCVGGAQQGEVEEGGGQQQQQQQQQRACHAHSAS
jgi:molybdopterin synthase catalytic subunit